MILSTGENHTRNIEQFASLAKHSSSSTYVVALDQNQWREWLEMSYLPGHATVGDYLTSMAHGCRGHSDARTNSLVHMLVSESTGMSVQEPCAGELLRNYRTRCTKNLVQLSFFTAFTV